MVGGGMYGATIARYLVERRGFPRVVLYECEAALMTRASLRNQARIHAGYHYPRSWTTAARSRANVQRLVADHPSIVRRDVRSVYAIARANSMTNARQFSRFCREIGVSLEPAPPSVAALFDARSVESVFSVEEAVMDVAELARSVSVALGQSGVHVLTSRRVSAIRPESDGAIRIEFDSASAPPERARFVFNCTYGAIAALVPASERAGLGLAHELTEMAVVLAPPEFTGLAITVMDGPFFSLVPHTAPGTHTLSHVRYTPHASFASEVPTRHLRAPEQAFESRFPRMVRSASRFVPALAPARHLDSIFELKTILRRNETDDGRPIRFERSVAVPGLYSVLGGKIDNVYDVLDRLDAEPLPLPADAP